MLSRCQEAIKILEEPKFIGRFIPRISQKLIEAEKKDTEKIKANNQSPLRKTATVRFSFTVPNNRKTSTKNIDQQSPKMVIHKLMNILGIPDNVDLASPVSEEGANQLEEKKKEVSLLSLSSGRSKVETYSVFTQTEPQRCADCDKRNSIIYSNGQTQTMKEVKEMATQVSVEDLTKSCTTFIPRGILKTTSSPVKSISHLTPAQLLAQLEAEKTEDSSPQKQEKYPPVRRPLLDHKMGPDKLPEPPKFNNSSGNNFEPDRYESHMHGPGHGMGYNMNRSGIYGPPGGDRGPMGDRGLMGDRGSMSDRGLLQTPYQNPGPNRPYQHPGPNPNMPNYQNPGLNPNYPNHPNQGRPFQDSTSNPNMSVWNNPGPGMGARPPPLMGMGRGNPQMYYNQRGN